MPYGSYPLLKEGECYYWVLCWRDFSDYLYVEEWLKQYRKEAVKDQEFFLTAHKEFKDKFFKEEARYYMRLQRACTLMLGYFGEGDYRPSTDWPKELASELDEISNRIELKEERKKKMSNNAEYQIKTADNGYLIQRVLEVEVDNTQDAPFKDPYERSLFVFADWAGVVSWLNGNEPNKVNV